MKIGLLSLGAKPFHKGHLELLRKANEENDFTVAFVSLNNRKRKGEIEISGKVMAKIWKEELLDILPSKVNIAFVENQTPIQKIYSVLGNAEEDNKGHTYQVYGDPVDIARNFNQEKIQEYFPTLMNNANLVFRSVPRKDTADISGTQMRKFIEKGEKKLFLHYLPNGLDKEKIWNMLRKDYESTILNQLL